MKEEKYNIEELIYLYLAGEANSSEIEYLKLWLKEDNKNLQYYTELKTIWLLSQEGRNPHQFNTQKALLNFKNKTSKARLHIPVFLKYAAIFLIAFGLGGYLVYKVKPTDTNEDILSFNNEAEAPYGVRSKVNLPDGSQVWLNSGSKLYFPSIFTGYTREIKLIGEAYFEVQTNPEKPFVVSANGVIIKALGTTFNVKSYLDDSYVETTLIEGNVLVSKENSRNAPVSLKPNEKITIYINSDKVGLVNQNTLSQKKEVISENMILEKEVNPKRDISWHEDIWIIDDEVLESLAKKLERRYNVSIEFKDAAMLKYRYSGTIKDESVDKVLQVLTLTSPLIFTKTGNNIIFDIDEEKQDKFKNAWRLN